MLMWISSFSVVLIYTKMLTLRMELSAFPSGQSSLKLKGGASRTENLSSSALSALVKLHFNNYSESSFIRSLPGLSGDASNFSLTSRVYGPVRQSACLEWFLYSHICIDGKDTWKFNSEYGNEFLSNLTKLKLDRVTPPYRSSKLNFANMIDRDAAQSFYELLGKTLVLSCWRVAAERLQPAHFMFGYGKLFALIHDDGPPFHVDNVVFHQCPDPYRGDDHNFLDAVWKIVSRSGFERGWFNLSTRFLSVGQGWDKNTLCASGALIDHTVGLSLGQNHRKTVFAWRSALENYVARYSGKVFGAKGMDLSMRHTLLRTRSKEPHIKIFQRKEGKALRNFLNMDDVLSVAQEYSPHVDVFSLSSNSSFFEAFHLFNSFDILITPHGSHLTNGLLIIPPSRPKIIEIVATCVNEDFKKNLGTYFADYEISTGHLIADKATRDAAAGCAGYSERGCSLSDSCTFGNVRSAGAADLFVNISVLRSALHKALSPNMDGKTMMAHLSVLS